MRNPLLDQKYSDYDELEGATRLIVPFIACGDLNVAPDADKTYPLEIDGREYRSCAPVASPISPPYERAKLMKQNNLLGKQIDHANATAAAAAAASSLVTVGSSSEIGGVTVGTVATTTTTTTTTQSPAAGVLVTSPDTTTAASNSAPATAGSNVVVSSFQNDENSSKLSDLTISN